MSALIAAVFLASVLGSLHCAGMCGAFLAVAMGGQDRGWKSGMVLQGAYHGGRLVSYVLLGAMAGAAGQLVNVAGALAGVRPVAAALAGATMVVFGGVTLLRLRGVSLGRMALPAGWSRVVQSGHRAAMERPPVVRALAIGLLTTLLPCGWLYAFAITAAGTGRPALGAVTMAAFWAGTLPVLVALGAGVQKVLGPVGRRLPGLTAVALVLVGLYTLVGRTLIDPATLVAKVQARQGVASVEEGGAKVPAATTEPECCRTK